MNDSKRILFLIENLKIEEKSKKCSLGYDLVKDPSPGTHSSGTRGGLGSEVLFLTEPGFLSRIENILSDRNKLINHINRNYFAKQITKRMSGDSYILCYERRIHNGSLTWCNIRISSPNLQERELAERIRSEDNLIVIREIDLTDRKYELFVKLLYGENLNLFYNNLGLPKIY